MKKRLFCLGLTLSVILTTTISASAQKRNKKSTEPEVSPKLYSNIEYRLVGPFRGGRSAAVTGIAGNNQLYFMGSTGGGVWKTENSGSTWENISDGFFGGTIGAVEVARSDNNIIYVAGGEKTVRGNVSHGYGIWKSLDGGETWNYKGLKEGQYMPRLRVHPKNADLVYVAVLGHLFGQNEERGIYRSQNGGESWEKILYIDDKTGGIDLILDPVNPRIIYASTWQVKRTAYSLESGGPGSALWKSSDGGDTWTNLNESDGMPDGPLGIIGVSLSADNPKKLYALIEAKEGGLFVSDDRGKNWHKVNSDRSLRQRAWYYTRLYVDPDDAETVYVLNVAFHKSTDGGRTFERINTPHGDHHDLWIDPENSSNIIIGDDGGAQITHDGGKEWSSLMNQATGQFYRVVTDNHFPYRIYGGQQDNSTVRIESRSLSGSINESNWESTAGGESAWIAPDPDDSDIVYGGSYGGYLIRVNHRTGESRRIDIWPDNPMGWGADSLKERFQWNFPILFSKHDNSTLYAASNRLFKTNNEGQSWKAISPDLTRNDLSKMGPSGGPITKDNTSVEYYGTIFAVTESDIEEGVIWCGSDDGMIHLTKDGGSNWEDVTPGNDLIPEWAMINSIEADPFNAGGLYVAASSYKYDDFSPYLLHSTDYGRTWNKIVSGIDNSHFTRVIRADHKRKGLLFAGTESGMYISFNDGASWNTFQLNLPIVPITDLEIRDNELVVATQGRAFWVFDYMDILRLADNKLLASDFKLLDPAPAYRLGGRSSNRESLTAGKNPPNGTVFNIYLNNESDLKDIKLEIFDLQGRLIKSFQSNTEGVEIASHLPYESFKPQKGLNQIVWNMNYPGALQVEKMILWSGSLGGPKAVPGRFKAILTVGEQKQETDFEILKNPLSSSSVEDLQKQFDFLISVRDKLTETHQAILDIRKIRERINAIATIIKDSGNKDISDKVSEIGKTLDEIENALYQTKNRSNQDPLNFPIKLNNKLAALNGVAATGDYKPTDQVYMVRDELVAEIDKQLQRLAVVLDIDISELNKMLHENNIPYLGTK